MSRNPLLPALLALLLFPGRPACAREARKGLSRADAEFRRAAVKDPEYALTLGVDAQSLDFSGRVSISFTLTEPLDGLTVDFDSGTVLGLEVNGRPSTPTYNGLFLTLDKGSLRAGANTVVISYKRAYSLTGAGFYRFRDPEDGRVYLYSMFEPYDANKLFPCFDQPDLKAPYALTLKAPAGWEAVSTAAEETTVEDGAQKTWVFAKTPPLSTYVFSVHAGPYRVWRSTAGDIPLRLFARQSLARHIDAAEWFEYTRQGLAFYGDYFALPYPFKKYDQVIAPDFNAGAMENAAAVAFAETYVHRSTPTLEEREDLASTILHEMGHMWFGDLVTMRWWDGLWLNESFATYMQALSGTQATRFTRSWNTFFVDEKRWAYLEDQFVTTHPIEGEVPDTEHAFSNFDGITYGKGASVLKQLAFLLGEDRFRDGIRAYLKAWAYGNTAEADFFAAMAKAGGLDLGAWTKQWLETAGANTVRADYACAKGAVTAFALHQSAEEGHPGLRRHRAEVALYGRGKDGALEERDVAAVTYEGARTPVPALVGRPCPALVYPNHGDHDYAKVELDARSLAAARTGLSHIGDPFLRAMLWHTLWEMVRDAKWPAAAYAELVLSELGKEADLKTAAFVLETVFGRRPNVSALLDLLPGPDPRVEAFCWENLAKAEPGSDIQKVWFDAFVKAAAGAESAGRLRRALEAAPAPGLAVDQDRRWAVLVRLNALGVPDGETLLEAEAKRDHSDSGVKAAITARAGRPELAGKKAWLAKITDPASTLSLGELRAAMAGFFPRGQPDRRAELQQAVLDALPALSALDGDFLDAYGRTMGAVVCTPQGLAAIDAALAKPGGVSSILVKDFRVVRQETERCLMVRAPKSP